MDLICDIDGPPSPVRNSTSSLLRWLEIPDDSTESRMFNDFGSSERHVSFFKETRRQASLRPFRC